MPEDLRLSAEDLTNDLADTLPLYFQGPKDTASEVASEVTYDKSTDPLFLGDLKLNDQ